MSKLGAALLPLFAQIKELVETAQKIAERHSRRQPQGAAIGNALVGGNGVRSRPAGWWS
jgi:hypothetical protein